jgi:2-polyprenyl-3-methyl-5-hydroxy-6-metoxy-1,4-benzoquinol methylase
MECKICSHNTELFSEGIILEKHKIKYYKCSNCGFIQTEEPYWLNESYSEAINRSDVGYVTRNLLYSKFTKLIISVFFNSKLKFVDFGSGYGLFVRLMRDYGLDYYWQDKYCENIFAKDFAAGELKEKSYELLTAFEVFEHIVNPLKEIKEMLKFSNSIFFSTYLIPNNYPKPGDWWYYALDTGQHISFYSPRTMQYLAKENDLNFYSNGRNFHLLTKKKVSAILFKLITFYPIAVLLNPIIRKRSLKDKDYQDVLRKIKSENID